MLTCDPIDAEQALRIGLVKSADDVMETCAWRVTAL
jgi:enoyl-CoA hydratase/carnithine racemase